MIKQITIAETKELWKSPDGERVLRAVKTTDGEEFRTYSDPIGNARPGTEFRVEQYMRDGKHGPEEFVKLAREEAGSPPGASSGGQSGGPSKDAAFSLSYAKDLTGALVTSGTVKTIEDARETWTALADVGLDWLRGKEPTSQQDEPSIDALVNALRDAGLLEAAREKGVSKAHLAEVFRNSGGNILNFVTEMRKELDPLPGF